MTNPSRISQSSKTFVSAFLAALAMTAILATVGIGATAKKAPKPVRGAVGSAQVATPTGPPPTMAEELAKHTADRSARQASIAAELGISASDLSTAMDAVKSDKLAAKVAANQLTEAQSKAIVACDAAPLTCDRSDLPAGGPQGRRPEGGKGGAELASALAAKLNLPVASVKAAFKEYAPKRPAGPRGQRVAPPIS